MTTLLIASQNKHKIAEIKDKIAAIGIEDLDIVGLDAYPKYQAPPEDGLSFKDNALIKALAAAEMSGCITLADDSGLCVEALNGAPGIYSARYAGVNQDDAANNRKLLADMANQKNRNAYFYCAIIIAWPAGHYLEASAKFHGKLLDKLQGSGGFGYDPLLYLDDYQCTVAELGDGIKNKISHRALALDDALAKLKSVLE